MRVTSFSAIVSILTFLACASPPPRGAECASSPPATPTTAIPPPAASSASTPVIPYDLPKSGEFQAPPIEPPASGSYEDVRPIYVVSVDKQGKMYFAGKLVADTQELVQLAHDGVARDPSIRVVIHADRRAEWAHVVGAIDGLKQGGVEKIAFAVEPNQP